ASTVEIISDFLTLIGQDEVLAQMTERGTLQETADWVDTQIATFLSLIGRAGQLFSDAWDAISPANLPNLLDTLPDLANRAVALFGDVVAFGSTLISQILVFVRDSLLEWLSEKAHTMRGFKLLTVILGANPFTGAGVERNAENLIGGFIELIAGPDTYAQLAESGVIAEAAGKIESEMERLNISWELITGTFTAIWESLSLSDFLDPIGCIMRVIDQFGEPLSRIISFASTVVQVVLELILRLMNFPGDLLGSIIAGVQQALDNIQADPVGFLNNLLAALKQGFSQFFDNILTHLVQGLADWLFRGLKGLGIEIPTELSGESILKLALDVMGLSVEFLWECLGEVIGAEKVALIRGAIDKLGQAWAFIVDVQTRGMVAVWEYISSQLGNLWDTILGMAKDWLVSNIIDAAIAKVLSMLDPTGVMAVINSCIAFYRAVQSVIEYVTEILQIVKTYVDTIAAIAAGNSAPGATMLEGGLAAAIPVAIGFLASQVGLGDIPEKIVEIINGLRQAIKDAVIWLIRQAMRLGEAALNALGMGGSGDSPEPAPEEPSAAGAGALALPSTPIAFSMDGAGHSIWFERSGSGYQVTMASSHAGHLRARVDAALGDDNCPAGARPILAAASGELQRFESEIAEMDRLWSDPMNSNVPLNSAVLGREFTKGEYPQAVTTRLGAYRATLESLGGQFHMKDLTDMGHRSRYVTEDSISPEFREGWRRRFYGGWQGGIENTKWQESNQAGIRELRARDPAAAIPANPDVYCCASCGGCFSSGGGVPGYPIRPWHLDHIQPVASHFNSEGLNTTQDVRVGWYSRPINLQGLCSTCNLQKGSRDENGVASEVTSWRVHRRFRGSGDAGPDPSDEG
ncbi:MAG: HNH endonuclease, partial [Propionibacteriaceae bacterium]|nr:HNH endonuclease [Propionibacteriaceae bacterium]